MDEGWVKIYRKIFDSRTGCRGLEYVGAMVWLVVHACLKPSWTKFGDPIGRGELVVGYEYLAQAWHISVRSVRTIVSNLLEDNFMTSKPTYKGTILTISNYERYQETKDADRQAADKQPTSSRQATDNLIRMEECKNLNTLSPAGAGARESASEAIDSAEASAGQKALPAAKPTCYGFGEFWQAYGKFTDRHKAELAYAHVGEADRAAIKSRLPAYVSATPELRFRKDPLTWIHGRCWEDETLPQRGGGSPAEASHDGILHEYTFAPGESGTGIQAWEGLPR